MKPDIINIITREGVELKQKGVNHWGLCPFHSEKTPSFAVNPGKQKFKCFGCGVYGDVIDFIQMRYGLTFPEAKVKLGMEPDRKTRAMIEREKKQAKLVVDFRQWEARYSAYLGNAIRTTRDCLSKATEKQIEQFGYLYHGLTMWEHHLDVLTAGSDQDKFKLWGELK